MADEDPTTAVGAGPVLASLHTGYYDVACPHCPRQRRFGDELTARAWVTGHIQEEHEDELPAYGGRDD